MLIELTASLLKDKGDPDCRRDSNHFAKINEAGCPHCFVARHLILSAGA